MHLLIVYTGEFQTKKAPIGGIFQFNQARLLNSNGYKVNLKSLHYFPKAYFG